MRIFEAKPFIGGIPATASNPIRKKMVVYFILLANPPRFSSDLSFVA